MPHSQRDLRGESPEALHYLVCNVRTALRSLPQGSTEDVLEEDEPTLGSGLLGIAALPPAAQAVEEICSTTGAACRRAGWI